MSPVFFADLAAFFVFVGAWIFYEPALARKAYARSINSEMKQVRRAWILAVVKRDNRIADSNLIGHFLSSASFFASTNLLIIAAAAGVLFGGDKMVSAIGGLVFIAEAPSWLLEAKMALITFMLARGLVEFIWSIRQLNYSIVLMGAAPEWDEVELHEPFADAMANVLNPAFAAFNKGVRAYFFALAAAAWLFSPYLMGGSVLLAVYLLLRRQTTSDAALGVRAARDILTNKAELPRKTD